MSRNKYIDFVAMLSTEFHKYLMENKEFANSIPANTLIVFQVEGEDGFNEWHKKMSLKNREEGQTVICVNVKKWRRHSSIEELNLVVVA